MSSSSNTACLDFAVLFNCIHYIPILPFVINYYFLWNNIYAPRLPSAFLIPRLPHAISSCSLINRERFSSCEDQGHAPSAVLGPRKPPVDAGGYLSAGALCKKFMSDLHVEAPCERVPREERWWRPRTFERIQLKIYKQEMPISVVSSS